MTDDKFINMTFSNFDKTTSTGKAQMESLRSQHDYGQPAYGVSPLAFLYAVSKEVSLFEQIFLRKCFSGPKARSTLAILDFIGGGLEAQIDYALGNLDEFLREDNLRLQCERGIRIKQEKKHRRRMKKWKNYKF